MWVKKLADFKKSSVVMLQSAVAAVELKSGHKLDQLTFGILKLPHRISKHL